LSHRIAKRALDSGEKSSASWQVELMLQRVIRLDEKPMTFCAQRMLKPIAALVEVRTLSSQKVLKLIDMLEDLDDVQNVYSNAQISDEIMETLG
jgi:transcriptional/translational regulatory protein YebC/TACO1